MSDPGAWEWRSPPNWPLPPAGWYPPQGWVPPLEWPPPPAGWQFWWPVYPAPPQSASASAPPAPPVPPVPPSGLVSSPSSVAAALEADPAARRRLVIETWLVMVAFLAAPLMSAVVLFAQHTQGDTGLTRFPTLVHNDAVNMVLGILDYLPVAAMVPLGLLLLARTGQPPASLGLGRLRFGDDLVSGLGLAVLAFFGDLAAAIPLSPLFAHSSKLVNPVPVGHVPAYYVVWGVAVSATTAIAEETFVNAYLLTRLEQLGWSPRRALALSLTLRTSYHVYYGVAFLLTVPFGYVVTRSFQKHRRLNRVVAAHFLFDAVQIAITILTAS